MLTVKPEVLRQIDAEVARRVMGYEHVDFYRYVRERYPASLRHLGAHDTWRARWMDEHKYQWPVEDVVEEYGVRELMYWGVGEPHVVPFFSSDSADAGEVVEHARAHGLIIASAPLPGRGAPWEVEARDARGALLARATGPHPAQLVCMVALAGAGKMGDAYVHDGECR